MLQSMFMSSSDFELPSKVGIIDTPYNALY
jgi:hypothetical protein